MCLPSSLPFRFSHKFRALTRLLDSIFGMNAVIRFIRLTGGERGGHATVERACNPERRRTEKAETRRRAVASIALSVASTSLLVLCPLPATAESKDGRERRDGRDGRDGREPKDRADGTSVYSSEKMGFRFSYPSSFVVAFDRTDSYAPRSIPTDEDVALTSVGSYSKSFVTVTVFGKRVRDDVNGSSSPSSSLSSSSSTGKDFFYERVIQPVVDSPTTIGFSLTNESVGGGGGDVHYDFEFEHSVCRGETIEGKAGALRCIGNFGQDLPVQSRCVSLNVVDFR